MRPSLDRAGVSVRRALAGPRWAPLGEREMPLRDSIAGRSTLVPSDGPTSFRLLDGPAERLGEAPGAVRKRARASDATVVGAAAPTCPAIPVEPFARRRAATSALLGTRDGATIATGGLRRGRRVSRLSPPSPDSEGSAVRESEGDEQRRALPHSRPLRDPAPPALEAASEDKRATPRRGCSARWRAPPGTTARLPDAGRGGSKRRPSRGPVQEAGQEHAVLRTKGRRASHG